VSGTYSYENAGGQASPENAWRCPLLGAYSGPAETVPPWAAGLGRV